METKKKLRRTKPIHKQVVQEIELLDSTETQDSGKTQDSRKTRDSDKITDITPLESLFEAILLLKNIADMEKFFRDLCTPQELRDLAERWRVCQLLYEGTYSYREIRAITDASLTTISRVARFLTIEPHQGYKIALKRMPSHKRLKH
jgi:TrpR-related protein YerC/YecD